MIAAAACLCGTRFAGGRFSGTKNAGRHMAAPHLYIRLAGCVLQKLKRVRMP
jgi:hypothetical protein